MDWHKYFYYDESSPTKLRWKVTILTGQYKARVLVAEGDPTGPTTTSNGSYSVALNRKKYSVHRIIWELFFGAIPEGLLIDHKDGDPSNNHIGNLRLVTDKLNARNCTRAKNNSSGKTGVSYDKRRERWVAFWSELSGKIVHKSYTLKRYGDQAFTLACLCRDENIKRLNGLDAGYTDRHGN